MSALINLLGLTGFLCFIFLFSGRLILRLIHLTPPPPYRLSLQFTAGLLANLTLALLIPHLTVSIALLFLVAVLEALIEFKQTPFSWTRVKDGLGSAIWGLPLGLLIVLFFMIEPLSGWDARSIWFYHAKIIFHTGDIWANGSWKNEAAAFSHMDYPKLLPLLGAQSAWLCGFWNEYLPKLALFLLFTPLALMAHGIFQTNRLLGLFFISLFIFFTGNGFFLASGFADAWVALYGIMALVYFSAAIKSSSGLKNGIGCVLYLGIVLQLKNEGALFVLACGAAGVLIFYRHAWAGLKASFAQRAWPFKPLAEPPADDTEVVPPVLQTSFFPVFWRVGLRPDRSGGSFARSSFNKQCLAVLILALTPSLLWILGKSLQGVENELNLFSQKALLSAYHRLASEETRNLILTAITRDNPLLLPNLLLSLGIGCVVFVFHRAGMKSFLLFFLVGCFYLAGLILTYAATPYDLTWHLKSSTDRTLLLPALCFSGALFAAACSLVTPESLSAPKSDAP